MNNSCDKNMVSNTIDVNFKVEVLELIENYNCKGQKIDEQIKLRIKFTDDETADSDDFTIPLNGLDKFDWIGYDYRCELPDVNPTKAKRNIAKQIRSQIEDKIQKTHIIIDKMGLQTVKDEMIFCTGSEIIRSSSNKNEEPTIKTGEIPYRLDYDPSLSKWEVITGMLNLASLSPTAGRIILSYNVMWIIRAAYAAAWKQPRFCLFGYADTSSLKTAYISLMSYSGGDKVPPQLTSTLAGSIGIIKSKNDCITVFDDLRKNAANRKELEKLLIDITRGIANETFGTKIIGKEIVQIIPASGVIFTGEYEYGEGSDAARLLLVNVNISDERKLKPYQLNPQKIIGMFYHIFIEWYLTRYYRITEYLKKGWYEYYSEINIGVLRRLRETFFHLSTAYMILMEFCIENDVVSAEKAKLYQKSFDKMIIDIIQEQDKRARPNETHENESTNHLASIRTMYKAGRFQLAANPRAFTVNHDGFIHEGCLCLFQTRINETIRNSVFGKVSVESFWDSLKAQGVLKLTTNGKCPKQINCNGKSPRFYRIPLENLE